MIMTSNTSRSTPLTVRLVPSMATEPFSAMYRASAVGTRNDSLRAPPTSSRLTSSPMPSTWPDTKWPPRRDVGMSARSRFTRLPGLSAPRVVLASVSDEQSASKRPGEKRSTVRQAPLTETLSPRARGPSVVWTTSRASGPRAMRASIEPTSSTRPVNTGGM
jgi:hypothetical protein